MKKKIEISSFNPYESRFPNRKLVTLDQLILIKHLRSEGYHVNILPKSIKKTEYLFKKGVYEYLANPVNVFFLNIPITIITGLLTNYFQKIIDKKRDQKGVTIINKDNIIVNIAENNKTYTFDGIEIEKEKIKSLKKKLKKQQSDFLKNLK